MDEAGRLTVYPAEAARAAVVLAHGAGAGQRSPFMVRVARGFAARGVSAATFDFDYMRERRRAPDRTPALEAAWRAAVAEARHRVGSLPLFLGGKSMGGRIASHVASQGGAGPLAGLVFFGYPLHPPARPLQRRDAHLPAITEPLLFVQGERDPFGTGDEIRALLPSLRRAALHEVAGGDHSLKAPARAHGGADPLETALDVVVSWMHDALAA